MRIIENERPEPARHPSLPTLRGDLLLMHPPALFDFRQRRDEETDFSVTRTGKLTR